MTSDELIAAGFKRHAPNNGQFCTDLFQYTVRGGALKLYFVNVYRWDFPEPALIMFSLDSRFYFRNGTSFRVERQVESVTGVLDFCATIYRRMECVPDAHNN
jgi:hypothetical protein